MLGGHPGQTLTQNNYNNKTDRWHKLWDYEACSLWRLRENLNLANNLAFFCHQFCKISILMWVFKSLEAMSFRNQNKALTWCINSYCSSIVTQTIWTLVSVGTLFTTVTPIINTISSIGFIIAMAISNQLSIITT